MRDDERALRSMPPAKPPPEGELPFGPRNLSMYRLNFGSRAVLEGSHLGYRFAAKAAGRRTLHLGWDVRAELHRVDEEGRELGTVARIHRRLGQVEDLDLLQFSFPATLGFYRIDVAFESLRGRKLASYEEYFRVIPRRVKLRVAVSRPVFDRGEIAYARVLNLGTVAAELRPGLLVERKEDGKWIREAKPPVSAKSIKQFRWTLFGGRASPCVAFSIPADTPPGTYRFTSSALVFGKFKRKTLAAPFQVRIAG